MKASRRRQPASLRMRLAMLFAGFAGGWLLLVGVALDRAVALHFDALDRDELRARGAIVAGLLDAAERLPDHARVRMLDAVREASDGMAVDRDGPQDSARLTIGKPILDALSADDRARLEAGEAVRWSVDGGVFLGRRHMPSTTAEPPSPETRLLVALDVSHHEHFQQRVRLALLVAVLLAALGAYGIGSLVARRGLRPLGRVAATARGLSIDGLGARLPLDDAPSEVAELIAEFNAMLQRLQHGFERLREFSADIAHELRTPVSNLMTETAVSLGKARGADEYRDTLESNLEEFERLSRMISDLLLLAKTDHAASLVEVSGVDLHHEVAALFEFYEALAETHSLALTRDGEARIRGDRSMLRRALSNLLSNALRHAEPGSTVEIRIRAVAESRVHIEVRNTGETIAAERLPHVFERFYRASSDRHQRGEGAGLGLAITRSIVRAHGGSITAHSQDATTVFIIDLPAFATAPPVPGQPCSGSDSGQA